jgi:hypothetical protein
MVWHSTASLAVTCSALRTDDDVAGGGIVPGAYRPWLHAGLFARANSVNNNMRLYPKKILAREVRKYVREQIQTKCALGELDHPSYCAPTFKHLNLVNISHQVRPAPRRRMG